MDRTVLRGIVGSHAYGLNHADSDVDRLGVFVAPTLEVAGFDWQSSRETKTSSGPDQSEDFTEHEVGKFIKLALKANPTVTELLWLKQYETIEHEGALLLLARESFLSLKYVEAAYIGYASAQLNKLRVKEAYKPKYAKHAVRLARQAVTVVRDGVVNVRVDDPEWYNDVLMHEPYDTVLKIVTDELSKAQKLIEKYTPGSPLKELPDVDTAREVLHNIRKDNV